MKPTIEGIDPDYQPNPYRISDNDSKRKWSIQRLPERLIAVAVVCLLVSGCSSISYLGQAVAGQLSIVWQREPIEELLRDPDIDSALAQRLSLVLEIREFATDATGLPDNNSYRYYSDLGRPYVSWVVFAAGEFSVEPQRWCFPVAGCVNYRGYFNRDSADAFAHHLRQQGLDTYVTGVPAYSTLGWFDDPLLNTVLNYSEAHLAGLIFHELAHQRVYLAGDTEFNEGFAMAVQIEGVRRWLQQRERPELLLGYQNALRERRELTENVSALRDKLGELYRSDTSDTLKRSQKQQMFQRFVDSNQASFVSHRHGEPVFNNGWLVSQSSYYQWLDGFQQLLRDCGGDLSLFYRRVEALTTLPESDRHRQLRALTAKFEK